MKLFEKTPIQEDVVHVVDTVKAQLSPELYMPAKHFCGFPVPKGTEGTVIRISINRPFTFTDHQPFLMHIYFFKEIHPLHQWLVFLVRSFF